MTRFEESGERLALTGKYGLACTLNLAEVASNIEFAPSGLWIAPQSTGISYPSVGNESCFAVEDFSFWFRHRNNCILHAAQAFPPPGTFFDVGGGNGFVARGLQNVGTDVVLVEPGLVGARNALMRGIKNVVCSTLQDAHFRDNTLPAVGLFDVLEHIEDDGALLRHVNRLLTPGGRLYMTVPAFDVLWSHEDIKAGHFRRYTLGKLASLLKTCGYTVEFASYFFGFLVAPIALSRVLPFRLGLASAEDNHGVAASDHKPSNAVVEQVLDRLMKSELSKIAAGHPPKFGGSCLVVAQKSS